MVVLRPRISATDLPQRFSSRASFGFLLRCRLGLALLQRGFHSLLSLENKILTSIDPIPIYMKRYLGLERRADHWSVALRRQLTRQAIAPCRYLDGLLMGTRRWRAAFSRFLYDGQLEPYNLIAEQAIRGFTV